MKRRKGFIFIETLVVVAILTFSLLMTYSTYNAAVIREKNRVRFDDTAYLYRAYYLTQFFRNFRLDLVESNLQGTNILGGFGCQNQSIFLNEIDNLYFCETLFDSLHISNIYLTYNDLGYLQECTNFAGNCEVLGRVREDLANYLKTIGGNGSSGYRMIVEFSENKDGSGCSQDNCTYYYATLSLGAI